MQYMSKMSSRACRIVALSTAVANAGDLADWLGIESTGYIFLLNITYAFACKIGNKARCHEAAFLYLSSVTVVTKKHL